MWVKQKEGPDNTNDHSLKYTELEYIFWVVLIISGGNNLLFYPFSLMVITFLDFSPNFSFAFSIGLFIVGFFVSC